MRQGIVRWVAAGILGGASIGCAWAGGLDGEGAGDRFGTALAPAGDLDGDGVTDLLVGAPGHGTHDDGKAYVFSTASGLPILSWRGSSDQFGRSVAGGGDLDRDGIPDLLVSSAFRHGEVSGFSGRNGQRLLTLGGEGPGTDFGVSLAFAGDIDGDGRTDVCAGDPDAPLAGRGRVYFHSAAGARLRVLDGENDFDFFGQAITNVGDINKDGVDDTAIGAPGWQIDTGKVYLVDGRSGAILRSWTGRSPASHFGAALSGVGDLDKDGVPDLVIGAPWTDIYGEVTAVSGATGAVLWRQQGEFESYSAGTFGTSVAGAGDFNRDGFLDVVVGDLRISSRVCVLSGKEGRIIRSWKGEPWDDLGAAVAGLGDLNGDGCADIAVGAPKYDGPAGVDSGRVAGFLGFRQPGTTR